MNVAIIIAAVVLPIILYWLIRRRRDPLGRRVDAALSSGRNIWSKRFVDVAYEPGTASLYDAQLDAVDTGLQFTFDKARRRGWTFALDHGQYIIVVLKGEKYKGINCIRMPNGEWAAGVVADLKRKIIAIPEHAPDELEELARIVGYEAEHVIAWCNDRAFYNRTKDHASGGGHPIF